MCYFALKECVNLSELFNIWGGGLGLNGPAIKRITFFAASLSYKRKYIAKRLQARESTSICFGLIWTRQNNNFGTFTTCNRFFVLSKTFVQLFALILFDSFFAKDLKKYKFFNFFLHIYNLLAIRIIYFAL